VLHSKTKARVTIRVEAVLRSGWRRAFSSGLTENNSEVEKVRFHEAHRTFLLSDSHANHCVLRTDHSRFNRGAVSIVAFDKLFVFGRTHWAQGQEQFMVLEWYIVESLDGFEVVGAVALFEWHFGLAHLTDQLPVFISVLAG
jgi:hypothetical protein